MAEETHNSEMPDLSGLTEEEREKVLSVLQKAKEFEFQVEEDKQQMRQPLEGLLSKYTNVMKGWQYRFFVLDPESGRLEYHEREEYKKQKPRGYVHLAGAVICPSDEDSQTFTVNAANSEIYRLRAIDAKERQHWVNRLRATAEYHTEHMNPALQSGPQPLASTAPRPSTMPLNRQSSGSIDSLNSGGPTQPPRRSRTGSASLPSSNGPSNNVRLSPIVVKKRSHHKSHVSSQQAPAPPQRDEFSEVKDMLARVQSTQNQLVSTIEDLPATGEDMGPLDKEMLLLKATSTATLSCLEQCLNILQQQQMPQPTLNNSFGATIEWLDPKVSNETFPWR